MNPGFGNLLRLACALGALLGAASARANVVPASPFTDHMVLQRGNDTPVWGTAAPGERVSVALAGQTQSTVAGGDGKWMVRLGNLEAGGPHTLAIRGDNRVELNDVYVGEVWLCSGQSNMDFTVARTAKYSFAGVENEAREVAAADHPQIRMFKGDWTMTYTPQAAVGGAWKVCTPENVREFSAVGYFFARALHKALGVPVGIIAQTRGSSTAEAWIRREALGTIPEMKTRLDAFDAAVRAFPDSAPGAPRRRDPVQDQHNPIVLFNGMIAPIVPYGIKGVLWYQGESVLDGAAGIRLYPKVQAALIGDWRALWRKPGLPFYIVQLAAYARANPEMRAAQATVLAMPRTGMAVTIDIGSRTNVHPKNKQDVGERLCRIALADAYGRRIESSGPVYRSMRVEGGAIRLQFSHLGGGLVARPELRAFEIAGGDGRFVPAVARIEGDGVVVSSPDVAVPAAVRYAWQGFPDGPNLYNKAGLPAAPFQTEAKSDIAP
jgi:sialate O-acetylesterase